MQYPRFGQPHFIFKKFRLPRYTFNRNGPETHMKHNPNMKSCLLLQSPKVINFHVASAPLGGLLAPCQFITASTSGNKCCRTPGWFIPAQSEGRPMDAAQCDATHNLGDLIFFGAMLKMAMPGAAHHSALELIVFRHSFDVRSPRTLSSWNPNEK